MGSMRILDGICKKVHKASTGVLEGVYKDSRLALGLHGLGVWGFGFVAKARVGV